MTLLADEAVDLVASWLALAPQHETPASARSMEQLEGVVTDPAGVAFVMQFVDRVVRPDDNAVAARQLAAIVRERDLPGFLSPLDRMLLRAGARLGPILPGVVHSARPATHALDRWASRGPGGTRSVGCTSRHGSKRGLRTQRQPSGRGGTRGTRSPAPPRRTTRSRRATRRRLRVGEGLGCCIPTQPLRT